MMQRIIFALFVFTFYCCSSEDSSDTNTEVLANYQVTIDSIYGEMTPFDWGWTFTTEPILQSYNLIADNNSIIFYSKPKMVLPDALANGEFTLLVEGAQYTKQIENLSLFKEGGWEIDEVNSILKISSKTYYEQFGIEKIDDEELIVVKNFKSGIEVPIESGMGYNFYLPIDFQIYLKLIPIQ